MSAYDVIVIGSGAGGGTLVHHLAPSGKRILLLERGDWLPREPQNWVGGGRLRRQPLHLARTPGTTTRRRRPSSRRCTTSSAARRSSTARRCTACARRTSASCATTTASRPPGRSATTRWSRTTRRPSSSTRCTARAARTRPSRPPSAPYPFPAVSHEPRIQQLPDDLAAAGHHPFHAPCGIMLNEADTRLQRVRAVPDLRRLPVPGAREVRRRGAGGAAGARAPQRDAAAQRRGRRRCARTRPARAVTEVVVDHDGQPGDASARTSSWSPAARPTRPSCCWPRPTTGTRTASPTAPTSSGATTRSTTARPCWRCPRSPTRRSSRRRWASTTSTSAATTSSTRWATSRWSASRRPTCSAARSRSRRSSRRRGRSSRWRATRSTSGCRPRTCRGPRTGSRWTATATCG